jgi:hypothetical protein
VIELKIGFCGGRKWASVEEKCANPFVGCLARDLSYQSNSSILPRFSALSALDFIPIETRHSSHGVEGGILHLCRKSLT